MPATLNPVEKLTECGSEDTRRRRVVAVLANVSEEKWGRRASEGRWSCILHLNVCYIPPAAKPGPQVPTKGYPVNLNDAHFFPLSGYDKVPNIP